MSELSERNDRPEGIEISKRAGPAEDIEGYCCPSAVARPNSFPPYRPGPGWKSSDVRGGILMGPRAGYRRPPLNNKPHKRNSQGAPTVPVNQIRCRSLLIYTPGSRIWYAGPPHTKSDGLNTTSRKIGDQQPRGAAATSCLLYTSPSPRDVEESRMPSSA